MKQIAPSKEFPPQHGFTVPEGYFEQLPNKIMQRTANAPAAGQVQATWFSRFRPALAGAGMALAFTGAFFATKYLQPDAVTMNPNTALAQVSQQDIYHYLVNNTEVQTADVAEVPASADVHELESIEVKQGDVNEDAAIEVLAEEYDYPTEK